MGMSRHMSSQQAAPAQGSPTIKIGTSGGSWARNMPATSAKRPEVITSFAPQSRAM